MVLFPIEPTEGLSLYIYNTSHNSTERREISVGINLRTTGSLGTQESCRPCCTCTTASVQTDRTVFRNLRDSGLSRHLKTDSVHQKGHAWPRWHSRKGIGGFGGREEAVLIPRGGLREGLALPLGERFGGGGALPCSLMAMRLRGAGQPPSQRSSGRSIRSELLTLVLRLRTGAVAHFAR